MKMKRSIELTEKYAVCPECGCDRIGNGKGKLIVDDETFMRSCACGWSVTVDDRKRNK
jgi:iron(III) transport system ATP-binding protein